MRGVLLLFPVVLWAQTPASPAKSAAAKPKPASAGTAKPAAKPVARTKPVPTPPALTTDTEKTIYALGLSIGQSISQFNLTPAELEIVKRALTDAAAKKPAIELSAWGPKIDPLMKQRGAEAADQQKLASKTYLDKTAAEPGFVKAESGLLYKELRPGTGASPKASDTVKVNYRGTMIDGSEFDSSYARNEPATFPLNGVIKCWTEGVQKMKVGGKATLVCPSDIAYGDSGKGPIPGNATLIFDIELLDVVGGGTGAQ